MSKAENSIKKSEMQKFACRWLRMLLIIAYSFLCLGGIVSYAFMEGPSANLAWTAPMFLWLAGALVLAFTPLRLWHLPLLASVIGFTSELCGIAFGIPFGRYEYTQRLGPAFMGVPFVLICAWLVLLVYVQGIIQSWRLPRIAQPLAGAAWMTAIDMVIDPLAAGPLGYWRWFDTGVYFGIPASNFLGWFVVSLIIFILLPYRWNPGKPLMVIGATVIAFFALIAFAIDFKWPGMLGFALLLAGFIPYPNPDEPELKC